MMSASSLPEITVVRPAETLLVETELIHLLLDAVQSGASVGFLPPLSEEEARDYWQAVFAEMAGGSHVLLLAREAGQIVGSVQLVLATKANARHRAEVQKLFVLQAQRRRGTGRALMLAVEQVAREHERTLLVLDTRQGDAAEQLYRSLGYSEAGVIPHYARGASGVLEATVVFYKSL